jgi:hypothetical protein
MNDFKQTDWATETNAHGGKRTGAGRKSSGKQTAVIRIDAELLPAIEQLKQGLNVVTDNQAEIERLLQHNEKLVYARDSAQQEAHKLKTELASLALLKAENEALKAKLGKSQLHTCQCLTAKGDQCGKNATHENKIHGFVVWTCDRHYKSAINKT